MAYDFKIECGRTVGFGQADALSRMIAEQSQSTEDLVIATATREAEAACRSVRKILIVDMDKVAEESAQDETLRNVMDFLRVDSWPPRSSPEIARYASLRQSLTLDNDCLFFGPRIVIPKCLQGRVLDLLHDGHPGIMRMKMLARSYVYCTNITKDIENCARGYRSCQETAKESIKATLFSWPMETEPWAIIHIDFAEPVNGKLFLIEMKSTTAKATIRQLSRLFAQFRIPRTLVSDNGSQFTSREFADFCEINGIEHVRSPPFHPQSNGHVERFVDTFKRTMRKLESPEMDADALQKFLAVYRRTPCPSSPNGRSPAENFLQRKIRSPLSLLTTSTARNTARNFPWKSNSTATTGLDPKPSHQTKSYGCASMEGTRENGHQEGLFPVMATPFMMYSSMALSKDATKINCAAISSKTSVKQQSIWTTSSWICSQPRHRLRQSLQRSSRKRLNQKMSRSQRR